MNKIRISSIQDMSYIILFFIIVVFMLMSIKVSAQPKYESLVEVEVSSGDTLWSIATKYSEGMTIPSYIALIKVENNLKDHHIYPGQVLYVPQLNSIKVGTANESDYLLSSKY
ncbi:cell division suppressor protein YneA [Anaerobacillus isosaccharinicus]|uniref:Cell division suppressor protein YneA n=1 Tax=Anaerobacillus isosaccharinicus TaxID=1532552 RepID=A0A7S7RA59_9BACI|nr:LysM peptidoglycan-binding domain-containing protein [Anaerobacillus isosaccharinicus]MBA5587240.1 LysM peptidoglycan-binding domain-containing protein [Anaerobacillus isosaccharinicus]QOY34566.1 LysM peptidoglycan-binding domain-containing protein [Anaerobacillus isosaccharinicus]